MKSKVVLITGATSGIGLTIARELSRDFTIVNFSRSPPCGEAEAVVTDAWSIDLSAGESAIRSALGEVKEKYPQIHGFVACSGVQQLATINAMKDSSLRQIFEVNLFANVFMLKALTRMRMLHRGASVVMLSSIASTRPDAGLAAYSMSKAALDNLIKVAATELASKGIRVNSVRPGLLETPLTNGERAYSRSFFDAEKHKYPLGDGRTLDVALAVRYLISDDARWVTGQSLTVDGGRSLWQ